MEAFLGKWVDGFKRYLGGDYTVKKEEINLVSNVLCL